MISPAPLMISSYLTLFSSLASTFALSEDEVRGREVEMRSGSRSDSAVSAGSLAGVSPFSCSVGGMARLSFEAEASEFSRGLTTPGVYASEIFGMLGMLGMLDFRALLKKFLAANREVGVLGGCSSFSGTLFVRLVFFEGGIYDVDCVGVGEAKGSELRNVCALWEADWKEFFVLVTREVRFDARREDFLGGKRPLSGELDVMRERFVVDAA